MSAAIPSNVSRYSPGRPATSRDVEISLNGRMNYLGVIISTGTAVDNSSATSAGPTGVLGGFNATAQAAVGTTPANLYGTLAGRALIVQATAAGSILVAGAVIGTAGQATVTGLITATVSTQPGIKIQAEERVPFFMGPQDGWLQFIPTSGSANLFVWELT